MSRDESAMTALDSQWDKPGWVNPEPEDVWRRVAAAPLEPGLANRASPVLVAALVGPLVLCAALSATLGQVLSTPALDDPPIRLVVADATGSPLALDLGEPIGECHRGADTTAVASAAFGDPVIEADSGLFEWRRELGGRLSLCRRR